MHVTHRRLSVVFVILLAVWSAVPASVTQSFEAESIEAATAATAGITATSPSACSDRKYNLMGPRWADTLRWSFKASTTPSGLTTTATLPVLQRAFDNIVSGRNDCGRGDQIGATHKYMGATTARIGVTSTGSCRASDGQTVVGFGSLPSGVLGMTCIRWYNGKITEMDIRLSTGVRWALTTVGCRGAFMLEAVATHEAGHAFGLAHVSESSHGRLTMSTYIDGQCQNREATLGLGDLLALEQLY